MAQDIQLPRDVEEGRLLADYKACLTEKLAAKRLVDTLAAIRLKCNEKWFAVRAHRKKMRDEGK